MVRGLEPLVVLWAGWGLQFVVLLSFTLQVTLLLLSDIRRRKDWAVLKAIIWSAYMLADTTAIYALGHMSVVFRWAPEHHSQLMALWAPLLLVHLGGQDNISAYAIEDNRLWMRHLQTFVLQVAAAAYVLYLSSILSHPMSSNVSLAAMLMFVVGVLKYGERIWALKRANSCASSSLSATSYDKVWVPRTAGESNLARAINQWNRRLIIAHSLLDVLRQMFEGPTSYVQISSVDNNMVHEAKAMFGVVQMQLWMMYDLLYTKAAVVHTWYGLCIRVFISLPFTVTALVLFRSSSMSHDYKDTASAIGLDYFSYKRADVAITNVLLVGAVVLETMSVVRAIFSKWTVILLYGRGWNTIGDVVFSVVAVVSGAMERLVGSGSYWSVPMRQHNFFVVKDRTGRRGSKIAKRVGVEDWWDSNVYSWSTKVPALVIVKVLELVSKTTEDITSSHVGMNALLRGMNNDYDMAAWIWNQEELKLEERILVWHIATRVYIEWWDKETSLDWTREEKHTIKAAEAVSNYMFFLLAARPYMLPYPVSRQAYLQLCSVVMTRGREWSWIHTKDTLVDNINKQMEALLEATPLQPFKGIGPQRKEEIGESSMNTTLDRGYELRQS